MVELLAAAVENDGEKIAISFGEVVIDFLLGMVVIIGVLAILVGLLYIVRYAIKAIETPRKSKAAETPKANTVLPVTDEDEEVVAAITAAITCILSEEAAGGTVVAPFKIKKIKQIR